MQVVPGSAFKLPDMKDKEGNLLIRVVLFQKYENSNLPRQVGGFTAKPFFFNKEFDEEQKKYEALL